MTYIGSDGAKHRPYMIHRALLGSIERFFGILTEHYGGIFPAWLAPEQARLLPISDDFIPYAKSVEKTLRDHNLRVTVDCEPDTIGAKIRHARQDGVLYMLVVGEREQDSGTVAVRRRGEGETGALPVSTFVEQLAAEVREKR